MSEKKQKKKKSNHIRKYSHFLQPSGIDSQKIVILKLDLLPTKIEIILEPNSCHKTFHTFCFQVTDKKWQIFWSKSRFCLIGNFSTKKEATKMLKKIIIQLKENGYSWYSE